MKFGDIIHYDIDELKNNEKLLVIGMKNADSFNAIPLTKKLSEYKEDRWNNWAIKYVGKNKLKIVKATPDEILKAIVLTKNEEWRDKLKKLLKELL